MSFASKIRIAMACALVAPALACSTANSDNAGTPTGSAGHANGGSGGGVQAGGGSAGVVVGNGGGVSNGGNGTGGNGTGGNGTGGNGTGGNGTGGNGTGGNGTGGGSAGTGTAGTGGTPAPNAGAATPFISYEAEDGTVGGGATIVKLTSPPTDRFSSPELEASGHAYVKLSGQGQYVEWKNNTGKNITFINVREAIPDAPGGGGIKSTLDVYINGTYRQSLNVSSEQTWGYEGNNHYNNESANPADGNPRTFYDETHAFLIGNPLAPGDTIRIEKGAQNNANFYYVDVIDLEAPPPAAAQPAGSISITDASFAAKPDDPNTDNSTALQNAINQAQSQQKTLWLPSGTFYFKNTGGLNAKGITIQGRRLECEESFTG